VSSSHLCRTVLTTSALILLAGPARAQSADNPTLTLTITGGWINGGHMWQLPRQEATTVLGGIDTVALERRFGTGLVVSVGAALFRSPHFGYSAELVYYGATTESRCAAPAAWAPDSLHLNEQACTDIQGKSLRTSVMALQLGATWRPIATGTIQPYLRAVAGPAYLGGSYVETSGTVRVPVSIGENPLRIRTLLGDPQTRALTWVGTLSAGVTLSISPGTQLRFEARDVVTNLPVATGPGNPAVEATPAQMGSKVFQLASFTVGLDIVLEQSRRPRRY
jgi:hypothetical protein